MFRWHRGEANLGGWHRPINAVGGLKESSKIREVEIHSINDTIQNNQSEILQEDLPLQQFYNNEEKMIDKGKRVHPELRNS